MIAEIELLDGTKLQIGDDGLWTGDKDLAADLNSHRRTCVRLQSPADGAPGYAAARAAAKLLGGKVTYLRPVAEGQPGTVY